MSRIVCILSCLWVLAGCATFREGGSAGQVLEHDSSRLVIVTLRNHPAPAVPSPGSTGRAYNAPSLYSLAPATRSSAKAVAAAHGLREISAWPIGLLGVHCIVFELPPGADRAAALERLRRDRRIESAQAYQSFTTLTTSRSDPYRSLQRNLDLMNVSGAHAWSRGAGVRVAVIDTGVDAAHPDLVGRVAVQANFVDDDEIRARDRHGTAVAGLIAAVENNEQGIVGIAPAARLHALRACWPDSGDDTRASCSTLTLAKALAAAIEARTEIVNLSLTGPADPLLTRLVEVGLRRGIVFVGATPPTNDRRSFPTGIAGVISVDSSGAANLPDSVLFAPGSEVLTLAPGGRYDFVSGSSLAAASVSGGIALLLARDRTLGAQEARELLARSSRMIPTPRGEASSVNLCAAVAVLVHKECL